MTVRRAVVLIGSAKAPGTSTSEALARYLRTRLDVGGVATTMLTVDCSSIRREDARLAACVADADLFVLATPLYVDSLPYLVTRALESLARDRTRAVQSRGCAFAVLVNCGFPEPQQCQTALDIARVFARRAGLEWAGGLALAEGGAIDGRPLDALGNLTKKVRAALDLTASALLEGATVPAEAVSLLMRPMMPSRVYTLLGNVNWKRQARRNGVRAQLAARPFAL